MLLDVYDLSCTRMDLHRGEEIVDFIFVKAVPVDVFSVI